MSHYARRLLQAIKFSDRRILNALPQMNIHSFDAGDLIWDQGCKVQSWNCIITGHVAAAVLVDKGGPMPVQVYGPHAWFGEQSLLTGQPSDLRYTCLSSVDVISMSKLCLDEALLGEPEFLRFLVGLVSWRVQQQMEMLTLMRLAYSPLRVLMALAQFAEAQHYHAGPVFAAQCDPEIDIPIVQGQLACLCGVSRTLLSECLQHLARSGWVKLRYGVIELQMADTWRNFARRQRQRQHIVTRPSITDLLGELALAHQERAQNESDAGDFFLSLPRHSHLGSVASGFTAAGAR